MVKVVLTNKTKDRERIVRLKTTSLSHRQRKVMRSQRKTLESGHSSIKDHGKILLNVIENNHC